MSETILGEETEFLDDNMAKFVDAYPDKVLLVKGNELIGAFDTESEAVNEGVKRFGKGPFLVRKAGEDTPEYFIPALAYGLLQERSSAHA